MLIEIRTHSPRNMTKVSVSIIEAEAIKSHKYADAGVELYIYEAPYNNESQRFVIVEKRSGLALLYAKTKRGAIKTLKECPVSAERLLQEVETQVNKYGELNNIDHLQKLSEFTPDHP